MLEEKEENKGTRDRLQAGNIRRGLYKRFPFSPPSFFSPTVWCTFHATVPPVEIKLPTPTEPPQRAPQPLLEADILTATIMMQLSRNPNPTKGRALCSNTAETTGNKQHITHRKDAGHRGISREITCTSESRSGIELL